MVAAKRTSSQIDSALALLHLLAFSIFIIGTGTINHRSLCRLHPRLKILRMFSLSVRQLFRMERCVCLLFLFRTFQRLDRISFNESSSLVATPSRLLGWDLLMGVATLLSLRLPHRRNAMAWHLCLFVQIYSIKKSFHIFCPWLHQSRRHHKTCSSKLWIG